jgi:DNA-binding beta-propeller fold protein YncE
LTVGFLVDSRRGGGSIYIPSAQGTGNNREISDIEDTTARPLTASVFRGEGGKQEAAAIAPVGAAAIRRSETAIRMCLSVAVDSVSILD